MKAFKSFLLSEMIFTILIGVSAFALFDTVLKSYYLSIFWVLLGVIALLTGILHYFVLQAAQKNISKFASKFILVTGIKMIIYLTFIVAYSFANPENAKSFLISFLILYLLYTTFEVFFAVKVMKLKRD